MLTRQGLTAAVALVTAKLGDVDVAQVDLTGEVPTADVVTALVELHTAMLAATLPPDAVDQYLRRLGCGAALIEESHS